MSLWSKIKGIFSKKEKQKLLSGSTENTIPEEISKSPEDEYKKELQDMAKQSNTEKNFEEDPFQRSMQALQQNLQDFEASRQRRQAIHEQVQERRKQQQKEMQERSQTRLQQNSEYFQMLNEAENHSNDVYGDSVRSLLSEIRKFGGSQKEKSNQMTTDDRDER